MEAYKCDICGRFYKKGANSSMNTNPITGSVIEWTPNKIRFSMDDKTNYSTNSHDICPNCVDRFRKMVYEIRDEAKMAGEEIPY